MKKLFILAIFITLCVTTGPVMSSAENESSCAVMPESGHDTDKDDIDDACDPIIDEPPLAVVPLPGFGTGPNAPNDSDVDDGTNPKGRENNPETEAPGIMIVPPLQGSSNTPPPPATQNNQRYATATIPLQTSEPPVSAPSVAGANTSTPGNPITAVARTDPQELKPEPKSYLTTIALTTLAIVLATATILKLRQHHK